MTKNNSALNVFDQANSNSKDSSTDKTIKSFEKLDPTFVIQEALKDGALYKMLLEQADDSIFLCSPDGQNLFVNPAASRMLGYSIDELLTMRIQDTYVPQERHISEERLKKLKDGEVLRFDRKMLRKDKSIVDVEVVVRTLPNGQMLGILREITARKESEMASRRLAAIVESSQDAIISKNLNGIIESWNQGAEKLFGYKAEEIIGKSITLLIPPDRLSEETEIISNIREGRRIEHYETVRRRKDGTLIDISLMVSPIKDAQGHIVGASKIARDVTERKHLTQALQRELEHHKKMEEELTRSNHDLEQFAYVASHDLQEPLHMINSFADLLDRRSGDKLGAREKEYLNFIHQGSVQAKLLIRELLEYSRIGRDRKFEEVDLNDVIAEVKIRLRFSIEESKADIHSEKLPKIQATHLEIVQLFQNLISNAIKYCKQLPPKIYIRVQKDNDKWLFSIEDNGIGIEPQYKERIFLMFQRLHVKSEYSGTGIGLAICKKIVEHHGGKIWVESQLDRGSTFYFTL